MKRNLLLGLLILNMCTVFSQKSSVNVGLTLLGVKDFSPFGGGIHFGYELAIPKVKFLAVEARLGIGKLVGDGLYQRSPNKEWNYSANYYMAGISPRGYYRLTCGLDLFLETEVGIARMSGETYFAEQNTWNPTKTVDNNYYSIRIGAVVPITEKMKLSLAFGYSSLDITNMLNSKLSTINYRFSNQVANFHTSATFHIIL